MARENVQYVAEAEKNYITAVWKTIMKPATNVMALAMSVKMMYTGIDLQTVHRQAVTRRQDQADHLHLNLIMEAI